MACDPTGELKAIVRRWIEVGWQSGDPSIVDELHAANFVDHDAAGRSPDNEGFKEGIISLYRAFPDLKAEVADMVVEAESGTVSVRWNAVGTHAGHYLGSKPTGKRINFKGIEIVRIQNGRITERWGEWDGIDLLVQLGRVML